MGDYFFNSSFSTRWISRCLFTYSLFPAARHRDVVFLHADEAFYSSVFKIDLFRQVLFLS